MNQLLHILVYVQEKPTSDDPRVKRWSIHGTYKEAAQEAVKYKSSQVNPWELTFEIKEN